MSAKKSRKAAPTPATPAHAAPEATPAGAAVTSANSISDPGIESATAPATPWLESSDPRKRKIAQVVLVVVWVYVAALWLLALDQWFDWGIFGP